MPSCSFVGSFKAEFTADRVWRPRGRLELAVVESIGWCNNSRPHETHSHMTSGSERTPAARARAQKPAGAARGEERR